MLYQLLCGQGLTLPQGGAHLVIFASVASLDSSVQSPSQGDAGSQDPNLPSAEGLSFKPGWCPSGGPRAQAGV